ncbi:MAG: hypothetical protein ACW98Y_04855 [Candidatus Thorarchaeota archaeon]|jgi:hypothetical protein
MILQVAFDITTLIYTIVPIIIGVGGGYAIGGQTRLRAVDRFLYAGIVSLIGGIISGLVVAAFVLPGQYSFLLAILSFAGGCALGMTMNWAPTPKNQAQRHVVFDPEEDDKEFDRQIEDAFRGSDN